MDASIKEIKVERGENYCWLEKSKAQNRDEGCSPILMQLRGSREPGSQSIYSGKQTNGMHVKNSQSR